MRHEVRGVLFTSWLGGAGFADRLEDRWDKGPPLPCADHVSPHWFIRGATPHSPIRRW